MNANKLIIELLKQLIENLEKGEDYGDLLLGLIPLLGATKSVIQSQESEKLSSFKRQIKKIIEKDALKALATFKSNLHENSATYNEVTILIAAYNRTHQYLTKGIIKFEISLLEFTRIDNAILLILDDLEEMDLK